MFLKSYYEAAQAGYDAIIVTTLNAEASGTCQSALIARDMFYEKEEYRSIPVEVIDSTSYAYLIGLHLEKAAEMAQQGGSFDTVIAYLKERFSRIQAYATVYTLDFLKRTGRINGATNFVANLLDIKPILLIGNAEIRPVDKVRGKKKSVARLIALVKEHMDPNERELSIVCGDMADEYAELKTALAQEFPGFTIHDSQMGSVIALNAGPKLLGVAFIKKA